MTSVISNANQEAYMPQRRGVAVALLSGAELAMLLGYLTDVRGGERDRRSVSAGLAPWQLCAQIDLPPANCCTYREDLAILCCLLPSAIVHSASVQVWMQGDQLAVSLPLIVCCCR
jgi:hypothetical protein